MKIIEEIGFQTTQATYDLFPCLPLLRVNRAEGLSLAHAKPIIIDPPRIQPTFLRKNLQMLRDLNEKARKRKRIINIQFYVLKFLSKIQLI